MRRLEFKSGGSAKFWEARQQGKQLHLRWGKLGTNGQSKTKEFATSSAAEAELEKAAQSKLKKGYVEVGSANAVTTKKPPAEKAAAKKAPTKKAAATKKSASTPPTQLTGLCFMPEQASELARGWPHLRVLEDGHPDDEKLPASLGRALDAIDPHYHITWPTKVARGFVRLMGKTDRVTDATKKHGWETVSTAPVTEQEARKILAHLLTPTMNYEFHVHDLVLLLEAMVGADVVGDALVAAYEKLPMKKWRSNNPHDEKYATLALGYVLRRASKTQDKSLRTRIAKILEGPVGKEENGDWLRLTIAGVEGVQRHHYTANIPLRLELCDFVEDDPDHVYACSGAKFYPPTMNARHVYLAGHRVIENFLGSVARLPKSRIPQVVKEFGRFPSEFVVGMYLLLWKKKALREEMRAWFSRHEAFATPILEAAASDPEEAARITGHLAGKLTPATRAKLVAKQGSAMREVAKAILSEPASEVGSSAKPLTEQQVEKLFDQLTTKTAKALSDCLGDEPEEASVLREARDEYASIRAELGEEPEEAVVHFFAVDGCGLSRLRKPAFKRVASVDAQTLTRWCALLSD